MLDILYNMSADAYAKLVAHNNTVVQQFKSYKEAQERALADAYARLAALKEFCEKERQEMRDAFEKEKQAMRDGFELERRAIERRAIERRAIERQALERQAIERQALERQANLVNEIPSSNEQLISDFMTGFFKANQN
jgi:hypothetical protein